jgi:hypothetical protein
MSLFQAWKEEEEFDQAIGVRQYGWCSRRGLIPQVGDAGAVEEAFDLSVEECGRWKQGRVNVSAASCLLARRDRGGHDAYVITVLKPVD